MRSKVRLIAVSAFGSTALTVIPPAAAHAETPAASNTEVAQTIEEVVVTAQKRSENINNVGMAITSATGQLLKDRNISTVSGLSRIEPSLQFSVSQNNTPVYTIRGVGYYNSSIAAAPAVSVYQDEIPYTYPIMSKGALLDLDRAEILKGPQGTLYGQNATGGAINFIANHPTQTFSAGLDETYGRFNDNLLSGFVSGPLINTLQARLAASLEEGGAWQTSNTREDTLGNKDIKIARLLLDWRPDDKLKVGLNLNMWADDSQNQAAQLEGIRFLDPQYILPATAVPGGVNNPAFYLPVAPYSQYPAAIQALLANKPAPANDQAADWLPGTHPHNHETYYQASVRIDYNFSEALEFTSLTSIENYNQRDQHDYAGVDTVSVAGVIGGRVDTISQEVRLHGVFDDHRLTWLIGGNYESTATKEEQNFDPFLISASYLTGGSSESLLPLAPFTKYTDSSSNDIENLSIFANAQYSILNQLDVHAGVRYTDSRQSLSACSNIVSPSFDIFESYTLAALNGGAPPPVSLDECKIFHGVPGSETLAWISQT